MGVLEKRELIKQRIKSDHDCSGACLKCTKKFRLIDAMADANIPAGYWLLSMKKFTGPQSLKDVVDEYILNVKENYMSGKSICLAGSQGTGKTMSSICILKSAIKNNLSAYYTTASDIFTSMLGPQQNDMRKTTREVDFLVVDELDSRFFISDNAKEHFSGIYENIFRYRSHNLLPTILCTNETNGISDVFYGSAVQSIESLNAQYLTLYPVAGLDFRKNGQL
jgi:DNA replication protein DnaC